MNRTTKEVDISNIKIDENDIIITANPGSIKISFQS